MSNLDQNSQFFLRKLKQKTNKQNKTKNKKHFCPFLFKIGYKFTEIVKISFELLYQMLECTYCGIFKMAAIDLESSAWVTN